MVEEDKNLVNLEKRFLGNVNFYFNLDNYSIQNFHQDYKEWKNVMLGRQFESQGFQNFEALFLIASHNYLKKNQHFKDKSYYLRYFEENIITDEAEKSFEELDFNYYFINKQNKIEKLISGAVELSNDLKIWLLFNLRPDSTDNKNQLSPTSFFRLNQKVNYVEEVYLFPYMILKTDIKDLFFQIYKSNWSYAQTLVERSKIIVDLELTKQPHIQNAFKSIKESMECFKVSYLEKHDEENEFIYIYKNSKSVSNLSGLQKEIIGHKILSNYPKKTMVKEGDPTYWSVYSDLNLLQFLIEFSKKIGEVSSTTLKSVFERMAPSSDQKTYYASDAQKTQNFKKGLDKQKDDVGIEELSEFGLFNESNLESKLLKDVLSNVDIETQGIDFDDEVYEKTMILEFLKVNAQGLNEYEVEFLEIYYAELSAEQPELYLIISEYLEKREKLLHLIYKGKIMQESIENRILDQLGVRKVEKVMTYFDAMVEKINKYKIDILKQENTKTDKSLIINYFLYRFLK